jgi:signal transduction histidine kinase
MLSPTPRITRLIAPVDRLALPVRAAIAAGIWGVALGLTILLAPFIARSTFVFFWAAVVGAAWSVGLRAAMLSALGAVLAVNYLFVPPVRMLRLPGTTEIIQLALFFLVTSVLSALIDRLRVARRRLQEDAQQMSQLNQELQDQASELEEQASELEEQAMLLEEQNVALQGLADAADAANRAKGHFLATMSHELRTPINAALGYVEVLETELFGPVNPAQREALERIRRSQRRLLTLVTDVLSFARLESSRLELHPSNVPVAALLPELEEYVAPLAAARGVRYACTLPDASLVARADRDRMEQIVLNLVGNAIKFTEPGGEVRVVAEARDGEVRIAVRDTGRGIPADQLEAIFEPFVQVDQGLTRTAEGTGLGLAISRGLARAMGGDVTVESTPGAGSTFTVTMPRGVEEAAGTEARLAGGQSSAAPAVRAVPEL